MRKQLMTGLVILAASYSAISLAASGNIGSGPAGTDGAAGTSSGTSATLSNSKGGGLGGTLSGIFNGGVELTVNAGGLLVNPDGTPFTGKASDGNTYKDGKKQQ